jgi:hypothetical protein
MMPPVASSRLGEMAPNALVQVECARTALSTRTASYHSQPDTGHRVARYGMLRSDSAYSPCQRVGTPMAEPASCPPKVPVVRFLPPPAPLAMSGRGCSGRTPRPFPVPAERGSRRHRRNSPRQPSGRICRLSARCTLPVCPSIDPIATALSADRMPGLFLGRRYWRAGFLEACALPGASSCRRRRC